MSVFEQKLEQLERELSEIDNLIEVDWQEILEAMDCFIGNFFDNNYLTHYEELNQYIIEIEKYEQARQSFRLKIEQEMDEKTSDEEEMIREFHARTDKFMKKYYKTHPYLLDYFQESFIPLITHIQNCARRFPEFIDSLEYGLNRPFNRPFYRPTGLAIRDYFIHRIREGVPNLDFFVDHLTDLKGLLIFVKKLVILQRDYYHQTPERLNTIRIRNQTIRVMIFHHEITPQNIQEFLTENEQIFFQLQYGLKMVSG